MLRRVTGMLAVIIGGMVFVYSSWAAHRMDNGFTVPLGQWPAPYPDRWLWALGEYYDARYPVTGPYIKLHGEWFRVMRDVTWASRGGAAVCAVGLLMLLLPTVSRWLRSRQRGFEVVVK